jgi:hypothetical protein
VLFLIPLICMSFSSQYAVPHGEACQGNTSFVDGILTGLDVLDCLRLDV